MELNLMEQNIHLEFYGMPGCGKSTISDAIAARMKSQGKNVICASANTGNNICKLKRIILKTFRTCYIVIVDNQKYRSFVTVAKENGYTRFIPRLKQTVNLSQKAYFYMQKKGNIFIWDEGILQAAVSLSVNNGINCNKNIEKLLEDLITESKIIPIYLKLPIEEILRNLDKRKTNNSRVEKMNDIEKKKIMLGKYERACDEIDMPEAISISCFKKSIDEITEEVWDKIMGSLCL